MDLTTVSDLIVLMDDLEMEINLETVKNTWKRLTDRELPDETFIESLVHLWSRAKKKSQLSPNSLPSPVKPTEDSANAIADNGSASLLKGNLPEPDPPAFENDHPTVEPTLPETKLYGRYIYGIGLGEAPLLETAGIENNKVYLIGFRQLSAIVHACAPAPYQTDNRDQALVWLKTHQDVLDVCSHQFRTLIPMGFDVILNGDKTDDADLIVRQWLEERYDKLLQLADKLTDKSEYNIKASCDTVYLTQTAKSKNPAIAELSAKLAGMSKGTAYLYRSELTNMIRNAVEELQRTMAAEVRNQIRQYAFEIKEEPLGQNSDNETQKTIINLALLADGDQVEIIGELLEKIETDLKIKIQFSGPWPPYSFIEAVD